MRRILTVALAIAVAGPRPVAAQGSASLGAPASVAAATGTVARTAPLLTSSARDPIVTTWDALMAGAFILSAVTIAPVDRHFAERLQNPRTQENRFLRVPAEGLNFTAHPGSLIIGSGLYTYGRLADDREVAALGLHGLEAILIGTVVAGAIKIVAGRARPYIDVTNPFNFALMRGLDDKQYRSFPSGHTVSGFAAATVVTMETARWWHDSEWYVAPVMFGGAALIGVSRMYTNNHWASDVVIGAAIGTLAGVIIDRYHDSRPDNWIDRGLLPEEEGSATLLPARRYIVLWSIPMPR